MTAREEALFSDYNRIEIHCKFDMNLLWSPFMLYRWRIFVVREIKFKNISNCACSLPVLHLQCDNPSIKFDDFFNSKTSYRFQIPFHEHACTISTMIHVTILMTDVESKLKHALTNQETITLDVIQSGVGTKRCYKDVGCHQVARIARPEIVFPEKTN